MFVYLFILGGGSVEFGFWGGSKGAVWGWHFFFFGGGGR